LYLEKTSGGPNAVFLYSHLIVGPSLVTVGSIGPEI
jgi:hypothetical protein